MTAPDSPRSAHPKVAGRAAELGALTDAVRRILYFSCANRASPQETNRIAAVLSDIAEELAGTADGRSPRMDERFDISDPADLFQFDAYVGPYNPAAPLVVRTWAPPVLTARVTFTGLHEGPPGVAHGGTVAAVIDSLLTIVNVMTLGYPSPTARLEIDYRAPTPLTTVTVTCQVDDIDGRKIRSSAAMEADGVITAEARALFIDLGADPGTLGYGG